MYDVQILQTGSGGNCSIIDQHIMIDCGIKKSEFIALFDQIDVLLITHRHSDHMSVPILNWLYAKHYDWFIKNVYMNAESWEHFIRSSRLHPTIDKHKTLHTPQLLVLQTRDALYTCKTFELFHDTENQGFVLTDKYAHTLVWATDTRTMKACPPEQFDVICCEGNYDEDKLSIDLMSEDFSVQFRATRNLRHMSIQAFENFVKEHSHAETRVYQLHESHDYGNWTSEATQ